MSTDAIRLVLNRTRPPEQADPEAAARLVTEHGWDGVGFADSPRLFADPWLESERALAGTDVGLAGPCSAALGLRPAATVAAALRSLEQRHPGRVLTVVGRGESAVANEGLATASLTSYTASLRALAELAPPDAVSSGRVLGAASGPRTIARTAAALGAVLVDVGVHPDVVRTAVEVARRERPDVVVWLFLRAAVTGSTADAVAAAEPLVGSCAARMVATPDWYGLAAEQLDAVRRVADGHDYSRHGSTPARAGEVDEASALVRARFVVTGGPEQVAGSLRPLAGLGIGGLVLAGAVPGVTERLDDLGAALRSGLLAPGPPTDGSDR